MKTGRTMRGSTSKSAGRSKNIGWIAAGIAVGLGLVLAGAPSDAATTKRQPE